MSIQAIAWALKQRAGSPSAKLLLLAIANYADEEGVSWPSHARLAEDTELSRRSVVTVMKTLEQGGLVRKERRHDAGGYRVSDRIILGMKPDKPTTDSGPSEDAAPRKTKVQSGAHLSANNVAPKCNHFTAENRQEPSRTLNTKFEIGKFLPGSRTPSTLDAYQSAAATRLTEGLQEKGLLPAWMTLATAEEEAEAIKAERFKRKGLDTAMRILKAKQAGVT